MLRSGCVSPTASEYVSNMKDGVQVTIIFMADISTAFDKDWSTAWEAQQAWLEQKEEHDAAEAKKAKEVCLTSPHIIRSSMLSVLPHYVGQSHPLILACPLLYRQTRKKRKR